MEVLSSGVVGLVSTFSQVLTFASESGSMQLLSDAYSLIVKCIGCLVFAQGKTTNSSVQISNTASRFYHDSEFGIVTYSAYILQ